SPFGTTKSVSLVIIGVLLFIMVIDWVESNRKQLARVSSRSFGHVAFFWNDFCNRSNFKSWSDYLI
ncbi:MAG: hypothetical protein ABIJ05_03605, partial [Patescibacteria group bacterium]